MAIVITDDKHYKAIGQAIRQIVDAYEGDQPTYKPGEMAAGVQRVFQIGQRVGAENADSWDLYHQGYIDALENFCPEYTESGAMVRFDPLDDETDSAFNYPIKVVSGIAPIIKNLADAKSIKNGSNNTSVEVLNDGYTIISVGGSKAWSSADIEIDVTGLAGKTVYLKADAIEYTQTYPSGVLPIAYTTDGTVYLPAIQSSRLQSTFTIPENTTRFVLRITTNNTGETHDADNTLTVKGLMLSFNDYADWKPYGPVSGIAEVKLFKTGKNLWCFGNRIELINKVHTDLLAFPNPLPAGTYTLSATIESDHTGAFLIALYYTDGSNSLNNLPNANSSRTFTTTKAISGIRLYTNATVTAGTAIYTNIQLEAGNAVTAFEPYRQTVEYTAQLGQEVYGGTFNWTTGVLTVTHGADGTELGAPLTVQLTAEVIYALPGVVNTLYSNTGDTTVTYRVNPKEIIIALGSEI